MDWCSEYKQQKRITHHFVSDPIERGPVTGKLPVYTRANIARVSVKSSKKLHPWLVTSICSKINKPLDAAVCFHKFSVTLIHSMNNLLCYTSHQ